MANYRASESKREQFRRYLERSGVLDTLTSVLVALYEEQDKPNNALDYIKLHLGGSGQDPADAEALRLELADLQQKCTLLMEENKELRNRVSCCGSEFLSVVPLKRLTSCLVSSPSCCSTSRRLTREPRRSSLMERLFRVKHKK
uniref:MYC binding protein n=1 Tax=Kryptolebias marmoratus TaxID=37003 RepID=A0A3Q2ZDM8_KRYMA